MEPHYGNSQKISEAELTENEYAEKLHRNIFHLLKMIVFTTLFILVMCVFIIDMQNGVTVENETYFKKMKTAQVQETQPQATVNGSGSAAIMTGCTPVPLK